MHGPGGGGYCPLVPGLSEKVRSDVELLVAHLAGDRWAFSELVQRHRQRLYRAARQHCTTDEDADDAVQEALFKAYRAAGSFRRTSAVGTWLHRIVVNACIDRGRRNSLGAKLTGETPVQLIDDRTGQIETAVVVRQALMRLPADQRAAVVVVDMQGYTVAEAADLLKIAQGTVKSRRARARERLAVLLCQRAAD